MSKSSLDSRQHAQERSQPLASGASASAVSALDGLTDVAAQPTLAVALRTIRETLAMEVAFTTEIVGEDCVVRELDGDGSSFGYRQGLSTARSETICQRMLAGRVPNLIPDVLGDDRTASLPIVHARRLRSFATLPLTFSDGSLYGTLCAASHETKAFEYSQLQFMKVLARLVADQLERRQLNATNERLGALLDASDDAIAGLTRAGVITNWSAAGERLFGVPASAAVGRAVEELIALPEERDGLLRALSAAGDGKVVRRTGSRRRADGSPRFDAITLAPIHEPNGRVEALAAVVRDVSSEIYQAHYRMIEREVVGALSSASDATEATLGMLRGLGRGLDCQIAVMWGLDPSSRVLRCTELWTTEQAQEMPFVDALRGDRFAAGESLPGRVLAGGESIWIEGVERTSEARMQAAAAAGLKTAVAVPLRQNGEIVAVAEFLSANLTPRNGEMLAMGEAIVGRLADALARHHAQQALSEANHALEQRVSRRTDELERAVAELGAAQTEIVRRLSRAVEFRDQETGAHIGRISSFAERLARRAGLDDEHCALIERASPLHDIGKVGIPDSVLLKPGRLTRAERIVIETHTEIGHRLLSGSDFPVLQMAAMIALTHHERYDGNGYPHRLAGTEIPIEGRIVAIADVFDALTSHRVYRPAMTVEEATSILREGRGTHFDPGLLDHFLGDLAERGVDSDR